MIGICSRRNNLIIYELLSIVLKKKTVITFNEVAILIEEQCGGVNTELVARFKLSNKQEQQPDRRRCNRSQVSSFTEDSADTVWSHK